MARTKARSVLDALHRASDADTLLHLVVQELGKHALPDKVKVAFLDFAAPLLPRCVGLQQNSSSSVNKNSSPTRGSGGMSSTSGLLKPILLKLAPLAVLVPSATSPMRGASSTASSSSSFALKGSSGSGNGSTSSAGGGLLGAVAQRDRAELAASARDTIVALAKCCGGAVVVATLKGGLPLEHVTGLKEVLSHHGGGRGGSSSSNSHGNSATKTPTRDTSSSSSANVTLPWDTPAAKPPVPSPSVLSPHAPAAQARHSSIKPSEHSSKSPLHGRNRSPRNAESPSPGSRHHHRSPPTSTKQSSPFARTSATMNHRGGAVATAVSSPLSFNLSSELNISSSSAVTFSPSRSRHGEHDAAAPASAATAAAVEAALQQLPSTQPAHVRSAGARAIASLCTPKLQLPPPQVSSTLLMLLLLEGLHAAPRPPSGAPTGRDHNNSSSSGGSGGNVVELEELGRLHAFLTALHALHNSAYLERLDKDGFTSLVAQRLLALGDGTPLPAPPHSSSSDSSVSSSSGSGGPLPYEVAQKATEVRRKRTHMLHDWFNELWILFCPNLCSCMLLSILHIPYAQFYVIVTIITFIFCCITS